MAKKKKQKQEEVFHVEVITKARVAEDGEWEYLVKWGGYDSDANSWEPHTNVRECDRLLESFWLHVGMDNKDYDVGYEVSARPVWIDKEKKFYAEEYTRMLKQLEEEEQKEKKKKKGKTNSKSRRSSTSGKGKAQQSRTPEESDTDDSDDKPLCGTIKIPPLKKRRAVSTESSSASESFNQPLRKVSKTTTSLSTSKASVSTKGKEKEGRPSQPHAGPSRIASSPSSQPSLFSPSSSPDISLSASLPDSSTTPSNPNPKLTTTASVAPPPKPRNYKPKPKMKTLELPPSGGIISASGLSTKQRIAQGALAPVHPVKPPITAHKPNFPPPPRTSSLPSFKKSKPESPSQPEQQQQESSSPEHNMTYTGLFSDELVAEPTTYGLQDHIPLYDDQPLPPRVPTPELTFDHLVLPSDQRMSATDQFLKSVMPTSLAAPFDDETHMELDDGPVVPTSLVPSKPAPMLRRIPKKWKWAGELFIETALDKASKLCDVSLTDTTDNLPEGVRFSVLFATMDSLRFGKLHSVTDLEMVLPACGPLQQLGKLGAQEDKDVDKLERLAKYMNTRHLVTFAPLHLDNASVAMMLVFPSAATTICERFRVPPDLCATGTFVAALFPWALMPIIYRKLEWRQPIEETHPTFPVSPLGGIVSVDNGAKRKRTLRYNPRYQRALRILKFPKKLHEWMSNPNRPYCVWWVGGDGTPNEPGLETALLHTIMTQCRAKNVGHKADVRAVFVHVGALHTLHKLPALVERRSKCFQISFYTYGTHERVPPERWGVREIYPVGGIVTFTPSALIANPMSVYDLIHQIAEHSLWECYLMPSVIGMVAKSAYSGADPLPMFDKGEFFHEFLLRFIEEGRLSLLKAPPLRRTPTAEDEPASFWASWQLKIRDLDSRGILEECINAFAELYSNTPEPDLSTAIEAEISRDLALMQMQPTIMDEHRRFVVIKGLDDNHLEWNKDGFEWLTISKFDFKDDFFATRATRKTATAVETKKTEHR